MKFIILFNMYFVEGILEVIVRSIEVLESKVYLFLFNIYLFSFDWVLSKV